MATVGIVLAQRAGEGVPVLKSRVQGSEAKTSSGSSQATTLTAPSDDFYWLVSSTGAIWVTFASSPNAAAGTTYLLPAGGMLFVEATLGDKCAVIDA